MSVPEGLHWGWKLVGTDLATDLTGAYGLVLPDGWGLTADGHAVRSGS